MTENPLDFLNFVSQEPILSIFLFILPGFVGFITMLTFLPIAEKAIRWRIYNINWYVILTGSLIWSAIAYFIMFKINYPSDILKNMNVFNALLLMAISIFVAELIFIFLIVSIFLTKILFTLFDFFSYKKPSYHYITYFSWSRFKSLWKKNRLQKIRGLMIDKQYEEIKNAIYNRKILKIKLKNGDVIEGRMSKKLSDMSYDMSHFKIVTKDSIFVLKLKDIESVSIKK